MSPSRPINELPHIFWPGLNAPVFQGFVWDCASNDFQLQMPSDWRGCLNWRYLAIEDAYLDKGLGRKARQYIVSTDLEHRRRRPGCVVLCIELLCT